MKKKLIEIHNLHKKFKSVHAVQGISFDIFEGEFVAILGPNGAGKTTLMEMIENLQTPTSGSITIAQKEWKKQENQIRDIMGLSLQETFFYDRLTLKETLDLFGSFYGLDTKRSIEVLKLIKLEEKAKAFVSTLSGGQRQRLALGIALLNKPSILLLDEPTTGLDPNARRDIWNILKELKQNHQMALLLTTHYMEEAEFLCDRIIIIDQGKILAEGSLQELLQESLSNHVIEFSLPNSGFNFHHPYIKEIKIQRDTQKVEIRTNNLSELLTAIIQDFNEKKIEMTNLLTRRVTLDDLFILKTGRKLE